MNATRNWVALAAVGVLALGVLISACGGSSGESATSGTTANEGEAKAGGEGSEGASLASAEELLAPYLGQPSAFPVTEKLKEIPKGADIAYVDCGTPICAVFWELMQPAAQTMGVKLERVKAGASATAVASAFDSVVATQPAAVIVSAINVELWSKQLKELQEAGIPVVTTGVEGAEEHGIEAPGASNKSVELGGSLLAAYAVTQMGQGQKTNAVFYDTPELPFTTLSGEVFSAELKKLCPGRTVRTVPIPASTLGNTAPNTVVSDLQANPETNLAVFGTDEVAAGLPTALQAAGIEIETLGSAPGPAELEYIKDGKQTAGLAADLPVASWTLIDQAAREITGQKLVGPEAEGIGVSQFVTAKDLPQDVSKGWTGYPNFAEMFAELWGVKP